MKYAVLTVCLTLMCTATFAQDKSLKPAAQPAKEMTQQDEIRATASSLKATHASVSENLGNANKLVESATPENKEAATATRDGLLNAQKSLEQALTAVSTATPENWKEIKAKAEATNTSAIEIASSVKGKLAPAVD